LHRPRSALLSELAVDDLAPRLRKRGGHGRPRLSRGAVHDADAEPAAAPARPARHPDPHADERAAAELWLDRAAWARRPGDPDPARAASAPAAGRLHVQRGRGPARTDPDLHSAGGTAYRERAGEAAAILRGGGRRPRCPALAGLRTCHPAAGGPRAVRRL